MSLLDARQISPLSGLDINVRYDKQAIEIQFRGVGGGNYDVALNLGEKYSFTLTKNGLSVVAYLNGISFISFTLPSDPINSTKLPSIGSRDDELFFDGQIYSVNINNELLIPYPHLAIGFDQNNEPVTLTVNGGVTEGYDEQGSLYMQDNGAVDRNPELVVNGDNEIALFSTTPSTITSNGSIS